MRLAALLDEAVRVDKVARGNIQAFDPESKTLKIVCHLGFGDEFLRHFETVRPSGPSACGRAFGSADCVVIPDVENDEAFRPHREIARISGFRSVKSVPVKDAAGRLLGVLSTHSVNVRHDWERDSTHPVAADIAAILATLPMNRNTRG